MRILRNFSRVSSKVFEQSSSALAGSVQTTSLQPTLPERFVVNRSYNRRFSRKPALDYTNLRCLLQHRALHNEEQFDDKQHLAYDRTAKLNRVYETDSIDVYRLLNHQSFVVGGAEGLK